MNLRPPNLSLLPVFLPEELVAEVLSFLPVKSLVRLICVSKSWKSLISGPTFVKQHLNRSAQNADLTLVSSWNGIFFTVIRLLQNPPITINLPNDPYHQWMDKGCFHMVGSCNGLLCLLGGSIANGYREYYLCFWNPATRTISEKLGYTSDHKDLYCHRNLTFGYDDLTDTYKVVYFIPNSRKVKVFSLGYNVWTNIQNSPLDHYDEKNVVHLRGCFIWLAIHSHNITPNIVIVSLDLGTEIYTQLLLPKGFDVVPFDTPNLSVLKDCLCFSHNFYETHFVIWQMKEFGVEDSWTQFLKISYRDLQIDCPFYQSQYSFLPLCLSEKNDTLLLTDNYQRDKIILYNWRDNRATGIKKSWSLNSKNYVESLVWYC